MSAKTEDQIVAIIRKALDAGDAPITAQTAAADISQWDSLGQINIIVALDEALGGGVSDIEDMASAASVPAILKVLRAAGKVATA